MLSKVINFGGKTFASELLFIPGWMDGPIYKAIIILGLPMLTKMVGDIYIMNCTE